MSAPLTEITAIVRGILRDPTLELTENRHFEDLAGWDSMDLVAVVVEAECRFDIQFELTEIDRLVTVGDLLHMIVTKQALTSV